MNSSAAIHVRWNMNRLEMNSSDDFMFKIDEITSDEFIRPFHVQKEMNVPNMNSSPNFMFNTEMNMGMNWICINEILNWVGLVNEGMNS